MNNDLIQYLLATIPNAKLVADDRQILCRCPKCMDSANPTSAHFYIGPLQDSSKPLQYNCKKCGASGLLTPKTLQEFGIYDLELATMLAEYNGSILNTKEWINHMSNEGVIHKIVNSIPEYSLPELTQAKMKYINGRLGLNLSLQEMVDNKIVLNLYDFLSTNRNTVKELTRIRDIADQLDYYFIGFLSYDNGYINMRRLCEEGKLYKSIDKRYINYNIFNTIDNSMRFYVIPNQIDLTNPDPIDVWIAEGPFDALSIKYNLADKRSICISAGGKGYLVVVKFILQYLGLINIRLHLCPDGDVDDWSMHHIMNQLTPFNIEAYIHRNTYSGEKDFGVPISRIQDQSNRIN